MIESNLNSSDELQSLEEQNKQQEIKEEEATDEDKYAIIERKNNIMLSNKF